MPRPHGPGLCLLLIAGLFAPSAAQNVSVRRIQVLGNNNAVEIEIEGSARLTPQTQVLTAPDRLVVDFPNATPGAQLRSHSVERGELKSLRVGLFQANPPVTRVVLDLKSPQSFEVFPYGRTVMIKLSPAAQEADGVDYFPPVTRPGLLNASFSQARLTPFQTGPAAKPSLDVSFSNGLLSIKANRASLSEVLFAVHQRTGAEVAIAAGAEQEQVVADLGPAPAPDVLARLLNGSKFNFLILGSASDPRVLDRVILSPRGEASLTSAVNAIPSPNSGDDSDDDAPPPPPPSARATPLPPPVAVPAVGNVPPQTQPDRPAEDNSPD